MIFLKSFVKQQKSEVNYGTYRETTRSSLLNEGLSTRANSVWKQSQFVVAYWSSTNEPNKVSDYLKGWSELTRGIYDQYLILECPKNTWLVFDKLCNQMKLNDLVNVPQKFIGSSVNSQHKGESNQIIYYGAPGTGKSHKIKEKLAETDYIACKIAEGVATKEEYAEAIEQRQIWREEINELEATGEEDKQCQEY